MKKVVIFGAGRRVQSHIIPAVINCEGEMTLSAIYARKKRSISVLDKQYQIDVVNKSSISDIQKSDIVVICVSPESVPIVLSYLLENNCVNKRIFIDTPVLTGKNIKHYGLIKKFKHIFVLEDWLALNKFDLATSLIKIGKIGKVKKICFFHSGYRHHAVAISRRWTGAGIIKSIKYTKYSSNFNEFSFRDDSRAITWILEPRNYENGTFLIIGESGTISDYGIDSKNHYFINTQFSNNMLVTSIEHYENTDEFRLDFKDRRAKIVTSGMDDMDIMKIDSLSKILSSNNTEDKNSLLYPVLDAIYDKLLIDLSIRFGRFYDISFGNIGLIKFTISKLIFFSKNRTKENIN